MSQLNDLLMPKLGLTMTEGMLIEWSVTSGAEVKAGDSLFVVETDKVANEIVAQTIAGQRHRQLAAIGRPRGRAVVAL
ncbi:lipoyl domain-containing protein, partial [Bordetella bronchiseptica]